MGEGFSLKPACPPLLALIPTPKQSRHTTPSSASPPWPPTGAVQLSPSGSALNLGAIFVAAPAVAFGGVALLGQVVAVLIALGAEVAQQIAPKSCLCLALSLH